MTGLRKINRSSINFETRLKTISNQLLPDQNQNVETNKIMLTPEMLVIEFSDKTYTDELAKKLKKAGFKSVEVMNDMLLKFSSIPEVVKFFVEECRFNFGEFANFFAINQIDSNLWWQHIEKAKVDYRKLYMPKINQIETIENMLCLYCSGLGHYQQDKSLKDEATIYIENVMMCLNSLWRDSYVLTHGEKTDGTLFVVVEKRVNIPFSDKEIGNLLSELNLLNFLDPKTSDVEILSDYQLQKSNLSQSQQNNNNKGFGTSA